MRRGVRVTLSLGRSVTARVRGRGLRTQQPFIGSVTAWGKGELGTHQAFSWSVTAWGKNKSEGHTSSSVGVIQYVGERGVRDTPGIQWECYSMWGKGELGTHQAFSGSDTLCGGKRSYR